MLLPFTMTIAGSIPLLICILLWYFQKKSFSPILGMHLLKCSIFFYLVPIQLVQHLLPAPIYSFIFQRIPKPIAPIVIEFKNKFQIPYFDKFLLIPYWFAIVFGITFLVAAIFCIYEIRQYKKHMKYIVNTSQPLEKHSEHEPDVIMNDNSTIPYTVGLLRSCIVIPNSMKDMENVRMIYEHEKCHLSNKDGLMKLLCLVILLLHWYNPCSWLLIRFYNIISEYLCDVQVTKDYSEEEKKLYAKLLIDFSSQKEPLPVVWKSNFNNSPNNIKRRITYIMKNKNSKLFNKLLICLIFIITSCTTIYAFEPLESTNWISEPTDDEFMVFIPDGYITEDYYYLADIDFTKSDTIFLLEDGTQIPIYPNEQEKAACNHIFKTGRIYTNHIKNNEGGCSYDIYEATACTECGYIKSRTYVDTVTHTKCPH